MDFAEAKSVLIQSAIIEERRAIERCEIAVAKSRWLMAEAGTLIRGAGVPIREYRRIQAGVKPRAGEEKVR